MDKYTSGFDLKPWVRKVIKLLLLVSVLFVIYFCFTTTESKSIFACHTRNIQEYWTAYTGPWFHGSVDHLTSNIISLTGLGMLFLVYFSMNSFWKFWVIQFLISSNILFFLGDSGEHHLGASTWVYSFAGYLLSISLISKNRRIKSMALIIALWYGTMWWGLLPLIPNVSHEGHISGLITGVLIAIWKMPEWQQELAQEPAWLEPNEQRNDKTPNPYDSLTDEE